MLGMAASAEVVAAALRAATIGLAELGERLGEALRRMQAARASRD